MHTVLALYHERGWEPVIAPEIEFYLTQPNLNPSDPIEPPIGRTGHKGGPSVLLDYSSR
jgi:glutamine synthetase